MRSCRPWRHGRAGKSFRGNTEPTLGVSRWGAWSVQLLETVSGVSQRVHRVLDGADHLSHQHHPGRRDTPRIPAARDQVNPSKKCSWTSSANSGLAIANRQEGFVELAAAGDRAADRGIRTCHECTRRRGRFLRFCYFRRRLDFAVHARQLRQSGRMAVERGNAVSSMTPSAWPRVHRPTPLPRAPPCPTAIRTR